MRGLVCPHLRGTPPALYCSGLCGSLLPETYPSAVPAQPHPCGPGEAQTAASGRMQIWGLSQTEALSLPAHTLVAGSQGQSPLSTSSPISRGYVQPLWGPFWGLIMWPCSLSRSELGFTSPCPCVSMGFLPSILAASVLLSDKIQGQGATRVRGWKLMVSAGVTSVSSHRTQHCSPLVLSSKVKCAEFQFLLSFVSMSQHP